MAAVVEPILLSRINAKLSGKLSVTYALILQHQLTRLGYLLDHFSALKKLHQKILQEFRKACVEPAPDNVPTVKLPTPASEPESSQTAEPITL